MHHVNYERLTASVPSEQKAKKLEELPRWTKAEAIRRNGERVDVYSEDGEMVGWRRRVLVKVGEGLVDVGGYLEEHVS